jgi:hypothetical protein
LPFAFAAPTYPETARVMSPLQFPNHFAPGRATIDALIFAARASLGWAFTQAAAWVPGST